MEMFKLCSNVAVTTQKPLACSVQLGDFSFAPVDSKSDFYVE